MNNFVSDTIVSSRLNEYFGFTQKEVNKILSDADAITYADIIKNGMMDIILVIMIYIVRGML